MTESEPPLVVLGAVSAPFGIKGWVKLRSDTDPADRLLDYPDLRLLHRGSSSRCRIQARGHSGGRLTAKFAGVEDRDGAAALVGAQLGVPRTALPAQGPREHYWVDLIGFRVVDGSGRELGSVDHFVETPAHPLMVVRGRGDLLIPAVPRHLRRVDPEARRVVVDWDEPRE